MLTTACIANPLSNRFFSWAVGNVHTSCLSFYSEAAVSSFMVGMSDVYSADADEAMLCDLVNIGDVVQHLCLSSFSIVRISRKSA